MEAKLSCHQKTKPNNVRTWSLSSNVKERSAVWYIIAEEKRVEKSQTVKCNWDLSKIFRYACPVCYLQCCMPAASLYFLISLTTLISPSSIYLTLHAYLPAYISILTYIYIYRRPQLQGRGLIECITIYTYIYIYIWTSL